jgi:cyclic pyranopterin phosphate synthase
MNRLSHIAADGTAQMVDVSAKPMSVRVATAAGKIRLRPETIELVSKNQMAKGNVLATARIAGIQAAKQTPQLIPLCHNIVLSHVEVRIDVILDGLEVRCTARTAAQTGVEMEALTGVSIALLTIYDMCKAVDKEMEISDIHLLEKTKREL